MRKTLGAYLLVLALGCPVFAGEIHNPEPQPPPNVSEDKATEDVIENPPTPEETAVEVALLLLNSILTLP